MSQVKLQGNASGSGSVTIASPNTNSAFTVTLPAATGTFITTASAGTILQVVPTSFVGTQIGTANTSFVTTNFSASITPSSASSKVYVVFMGVNLNSNAAYYGAQTLYRNSTNLGGTDGMVQNNNSSAWLPFTISYVDSPATTSSTTYTIYQRTSNAANTVYVGWGATAIHTFVLMEIAA